MVAALLVYAASASGGLCDTALDCYLNGDCESNACVCDAAWDGDNCDWLALAAEAVQLWPPPNQPPPVNSSNLESSWGVTLLPDASGVIHGFFDVVCGAFTWMHVQGAVIVHATAPSVEGPFEYAGIALPQQTINPHVVANPSGGFTLACCHVNLPAPLPVCTGNATVDTDLRASLPHYAEVDRLVYDTTLPRQRHALGAPRVRGPVAAAAAASGGRQPGQPADCSGHAEDSFHLASAPTLAGPWVMHNATVTGAQATVPNPTPSIAFNPPVLQHASGEISAATRSKCSVQLAYYSSVPPPHRF